MQLPSPMQIAEINLMPANASECARANGLFLPPTIAKSHWPRHPTACDRIPSPQFRRTSIPNHPADVAAGLNYFRRNSLRNFLRRQLSLHTITNGDACALEPFQNGI